MKTAKVMANSIFGICLVISVLLWLSGQASLLNVVVGNVFIFLLARAVCLGPVYLYQGLRKEHGITSHPPGDAKPE